MGLSIMMCLGDLAYVSKMKTKPGWEVLSIKKVRIWIWLIDLTHHQDTKQPPKTFQILSKHPPINFKPSRSRFSTVREKAEWYGDNACRIKWRLCQTWNTSKTFRERKIWAKIFHKSSVIFDIFVKQIMRDLNIFGMTNCHLRASQIKWIHESVENHFKAFTAPYSPCTLCNKNHFTFSFVENLEPFFVCSVKSVLQFPHYGKNHKVLSIVWKLLPFVQQNSLNYLNVEDLLANFPLSTLCMDFFIQMICTLWNKKYFTFRLVESFKPFFPRSGMCT